MTRENFKKINYRGDHLARSLRSLKQDDRGANAPHLQTIKDTFVQDILDYWVDYNFKLSGEHTKGYALMCEYLNKMKKGTMFNGTDYHKNFANHKFTLQEVKNSIDNLAKAMNPDYEPRNKKYLANLKLQDFLYKGNSTAKDKSLFIKYLTPPNPLLKLPKDDYPEATKRLIFLYKKEILGSRAAELPNEDIVIFMKASKKLIGYFKDNKLRLNIGFKQPNDRTKAEWLFEAVISGTRDLSKVSPVWFVNEKTFTITLTKYLYHQNIFSKFV